MFKTLQQKNRMVKVVVGLVLGLICLAMVLTLGVGSVGTPGSSPDAVASVGGQDITINDVQTMLDRQMRGQQVPAILRGFYAKQILDQIIFERALEFEARQLGVQVTPQEVTDRIKQLLPTVFTGDTWVGKDRYAAEVEIRTGMSVPEFEQAIQQSLLVEKFQQLVTSAITVTPDEVQQEFRRKNEKIRIEYVEAKPTDLAATIQPSEAELNAYFEKNASHYQVPERRSARFALLDLAVLRQKTVVSDAELRADYDAHIDRYKVENRVHAEHILFKTVGKTDAEVAEIRKKAEDVLNKAKHGGNFEDLAKQNSEDTTKDKGGDLGWIVQGQTVPEFEHAAFSTPKGEISDLVKTQYGFHIIKVLDKETAHTKSFDEARPAILAALLDAKVQQLGNKMSDEMAAAVRRSSSQSLEDFAKSLEATDPMARQCLQLGETEPAGPNDPIGSLGNTPDLHDALLHLQTGELSRPLHIERGYLVLAVKQIAPAHQGKLDEVRNRVLEDYRREKSVDLARNRADELSKQVKAGADLAKAAKSMGLEVKTSEAFSRTGTVGDLGSARSLDAAFGMTVGQTSDPVLLSGNWVVYRLTDRQEANPDDFEKQKDQTEQELLQSKRTAAFDSFRTSLEDELRSQGKLTTNSEAMKRFTSPT